MESREVGGYVLFGIIIGWWIVLFAGLAFDILKNGIIVDCEKTLPRTEKCVLIAVPENTKGNNDGTYTR